MTGAENKSVASRGWEESMRDFGGDGVVLYHVFVVMDTRLYAFFKTQGRECYKK